jgi:hypothetical protein
MANPMSVVPDNVTVAGNPARIIKKSRSERLEFQIVSKYLRPDFEGQY